MDRAYRLGIVIVATTVLVSAGLSPALVAIANRSPARAAEDLEQAGLTREQFRQLL